MHHDSFIERLKETPELIGAACQTSALAEAAFKANPNTFPLLEFQTVEMALLYTSSDPMLIRDVHDQTPGICQFAIAANPDAIRYVRVQDPALVDKAVRYDPMTLRYVNNQTTKVCLLAAAGNVRALEHVRNDKRRYRVLKKHITEHPMDISEVTELARPRPGFYEKLCAIAVAVDNTAISHVPEPYRTQRVLRRLKDDTTYEYWSLTAPSGYEDSEIEGESSSE